MRTVEFACRYFLAVTNNVCNASIRVQLGNFSSHSKMIDVMSIHLHYSYVSDFPS